ncbi:condensin complex subunit 3 isoform X1 [Cydia fagiglandana]|uniref:condensin complex subunit 3 isoform X1 n=1 Tax=Cydia fagiglandana TaxID=1458189 RepID=UPI002FEE2830
MPPTDADVLQTVNMNKPKPNPKNDPTMFQIFQNVQYNIVQHKKYAKEMTKLYKKMDEQVFRESFKNALMYLFTFGDTSPNVDRVIKFVATFCTTLDDEEEFLFFIINIIFDCQCVSGQSVRYRASQLLEAVLSALGEDASLDEDLCTKLLQSQMQRLQDTRGAVRCRAALALQRLQDPMDPEDVVTRAYKFHMSCDPSASVRRAIVSQIAKCTRNVPYVLERLCDVDEAVRRAAFMYIANVNVTQLRVRQRVFTLKVGLSERSTRVRRVVEEILIPGWLSTFKGNIIDLLKAIRLDNAQDAKDSQYVAGKLLESLFKRLPISELLLWLPTEKTLRLIPAEKLNKETAWYWRYLAEHLQKTDDDETLEMVLPDLVVLIGYIRAIVESPCPSEADDPVSFSTRQYVLHELGCMLRVYDTDPPGRAALQNLITDVLTGDYGHLSADVIRPLVSALELVFPELSPRMEVVCGVIAALRDPPEPEAPPPAPLPQPDTQQIKMKRARLRVSLNVAIEAQEDAVREENYALAAECKAKVAEIQKQLEELEVQTAPPPPVHIPTIKEKVSDAETLIKCLTILNAALDTPQLKTVTPMLQTIFNELEVDIFQNPDILEPALETVALFGMLDKSFAKDNKAFFFANLIDTSNESVVLTVLRCIVDLLCVHGVRVFEDEESQDDSKNVSKRRKAYLDAVDEDGSISESILSLSPAHSTVIELLLKIMDSPCASYRLIIVEGLCRLLHLGQIESPSILSRLMLLWFNPATVEEDLLRQTIGVFFQTFPANVDGAQEQIQKATLPTLRTLANAPSSSPLSEIDQEAVVRFIVSLTRINHELTDSQGSMAMLLCSYLVRRPSSSEVGLACRMLALLSPPREAHQASVLANMLKELCLKLPDKQSTRNLTRYLGAIEASERLTMNKMSNTGVTEGTMQADDTTFANIGGRITTSLPTTQPLARSTHVVVNDTVEEEVEIDETSPTEVVSKITEENTETTERTPMAEDNSPDSVPDSQPTPGGGDSDSSGVSPIKKAKVTKGKKKKLSITRQGSDSNKANKKTKEVSEETENVKGKGKKSKETSEETEKGGIKRSRSQRSVVDVDRAQKAKATKSKKAPPKSSSPPPKSPTPPLKDIDTSNITVRKSRGLQSSSSTDSDSKVASRKSSENVPAKGRRKGKKEIKGKAKEKKAVTKTTSSRQTRASTSSRSSAGSFPPDDDSADETELHTIVYDNELQQSLLNDSSELADSRRDSKGNVTIPETPEGSDMSDSEPEEVITKPKGKRK